MIARGKIDNDVADLSGSDRRGLTIDRYGPTGKVEDANVKPVRVIERHPKRSAFGLPVFYLNRSAVVLELALSHCGKQLGIAWAGTRNRRKIDVLQVGLKPGNGSHRRRDAKKTKHTDGNYHRGGHSPRGCPDDLSPLTPERRCDFRARTDDQCGGERCDGEHPPREHA